MALDLNRLEVGGLAAAAGNNIGNLNLPVADWGAYGRLLAEKELERKKLQFAYDQMNNSNSQQQQDFMNQQALLGQRGQQTQDLQQSSQSFQGGQNDLNRAMQEKQFMAEQALRQQQVAQQGQYQQGQLALGQGQLGVDQSRLAQDAQFKQQDFQLTKDQMEQDSMFKQVKAMADMKQQERNQIGAFGATVSLLAKTNPQSVGMALDYGVKNGLINQDMADQFKGLPADQQQAIGALYASMSEHANDYAKMFAGQNQPKTSPGGIVVKTNPDGSQEVSIGTENKVGATAQQNVADTLKSIDQLESISKDYDKEYLTAMGGAKSQVGDTLSWMGLSDKTQDQIKELTGGVVDPKTLQKFKQNRSEFLSQLDNFKFQFIKSMSGVQYTDKQLQAMIQAIPSSSDSPVEFQGKVQGFLNLAKATVKTQQQVAAGGIPANTPEFQKAFTDRLQNNITKEIESKNIPGAMIDGEWVSSDELKEFSKRTGVSVKDILVRKGVFQ